MSAIEFLLFCVLSAFLWIACSDIAELDGGNAAKVDFPNANDLTNFTVTVRPDTGFWAGARYIFHFAIHQDYPHKAPKVLCQTKIYHPNIDLEGNVCLNILKEDWKPVLDINAVIYGLVYLFYEPNPDDPLNREAADLFRNDRTQVRISTKIHYNCYYDTTGDFVSLLSFAPVLVCTFILCIHYFTIYS